MAAPEQRAPKQDRSRITRERLLSASIDLLATQGWAATTVGAVAAAAGVSRGAAQHHFPTREDLIAAALEHMIAQRLAAVREMWHELPTSGPGRTEGVVRLIIDQYTSDLFKAALHVWTAAASDPVLRDRVLPLEVNMSREVLRLSRGRSGANPATYGSGGPSRRPSTSPGGWGWPTSWPMTRSGGTRSSSTGRIHSTPHCPTPRTRPTTGDRANGTRQRVAGTRRRVGIVCPVLTVDPGGG